MISRNKKILWGVLGVFALLAAYSFGYQYGHKTTLRSFVKQYKDSEIIVGYGRYIDYRNISTDISKGKYDYAKCAADLGASDLYDELLTCLSDKNCSKLIDKEKEYKIAPELFDKKPLGFKYYAVKGGIRSCDEVPH
jgi:hypothetical protein